MATLEQMTMWRFVTGLGMGGVTPLATTLISEWTSTTRAQRGRGAGHLRRCRWVARWPAGRSSTCEWEQMFLIGGLVPLALFVLFGFLLPESPKYMAQHPAQHARLARALNRLVGEKRFDGTEEFRGPGAGKRSSHWLATIWNSDYAKATLFIWVAFSFNSFVLYMYTNYLKVLLPTDGVGEGIAGSALSLFSIGAFFGSIGGAFLIRWFGSRWVGTAAGVPGRGGHVLIGAVTAADGQSDATSPCRCWLPGRHVHQRHAGVHVCRERAFLSRRKSAARRWAWRRRCRASARC